MEKSEKQDIIGKITFQKLQCTVCLTCVQVQPIFEKLPWFI